MLLLVHTNKKKLKTGLVYIGKLELDN